MLSDEENISACPKRRSLIMAQPYSTRKLWLPDDDLKLRGLRQEAQRFLGESADGETIRWPKQGI